MASTTSPKANRWREVWQASLSPSQTSKTEIYERVACAAPSGSVDAIERPENDARTASPRALFAAVSGLPAIKASESFYLLGDDLIRAPLLVHQPHDAGFRLSLQDRHLAAVARKIAERLALEFIGVALDVSRQ